MSRKPRRSSGFLGRSSGVAYFAVAMLWLLHWLPLPVLRGFGWLTGCLLFALARQRRAVVLTNLRLCFPELDETTRQRLARRHFIVFARAFFDRAYGWWSSPERLQRLTRVNGTEYLRDPQGRPTILLAPHFVGLDAGGTMMTLSGPLVSVYSNQKNPVFHRLMLRGRQRFNSPLLLSRQDGMRRVVRALQEGYPFYYLPDMDFGRRESIFVPFFAVAAATVPALSRLVRLTGARVVPCITRQVSDGYEVTLQAPWTDFPGESVEADTALMNRFIENEIRKMPEQYFWLHKRFKTRPPGEAKLYP